MAQEEIIEKAVLPLRVSFFDPDNNPVTPDSATYEIYCETTKTVIRTATTISPLAEVATITLDNSDTRIVDPRNIIETRRVLIKATFQGSLLMPQDFLINVRNVEQIT